MLRLQEKYCDEVAPALRKKFEYSSSMQIPRLSKVTVNIGVGEARENMRLLERAAEELIQITGQKCVITKARRSIANFKLREGMPVGCFVTLRRDKMWAFVDKLINVALPRVRDFRGVSPKGFDGRGNYNLGLKEQLLFPEINYDKVERVRGMTISFTTTAKTDMEAKELLALMGMPFRDKNKA